MSIDEIRKTIGADSLGYLWIDDLDKIAVGTKHGFCKGCFTGEYPVEVPDEIPKNRFEQKIWSENKCEGIRD
jgi:amidophosphoribosyltransferase